MGLCRAHGSPHAQTEYLTEPKPEITLPSGQVSAAAGAGITNPDRAKSGIKMMRQVKIGQAENATLTATLRRERAKQSAVTTAEILSWRHEGHAHWWPSGETDRTGRPTVFSPS